uniref:Col_cuticle_N domain-containing protein n=1 Tax=Panagrellus redivivus TaxID=6233 RepID=A0A7E4UP16_PANRE
MTDPIRPCAVVILLFLTNTIAEEIGQLLNSILERCEDKVDQVACVRKYAPSDLEQLGALPDQDELEEVYPLPGANTIGIFIMLVILALAVLIFNAAGFIYFFRWNRIPLSRKPTEDELDAVLDEDLPVMLINHEDRAAEFQFNARVPKDTQTIMQNEAPVSGQGDPPSSMPSELMSVANDKPAAGNGANGSGGGGGKGGGSRGGGGGGGGKGGPRGGGRRGGGGARGGGGGGGAGGGKKGGRRR